MCIRDSVGTLTSLDVSGLAGIGSLTVAGVSTFTGNIDANGSLDVDGHTELDNVNISGVSTHGSVATFNNNVNFIGQNSGRDITFRHGNTLLEFDDNAKAVFGTDGDLEIFHSGSASNILPVIFA